MSETVFKSVVEATSPGETPVGKEPTQDGSSRVEVPYLDYRQEHGKPFVADYFKLGDTWANAEGGFFKEVELIGDYVKGKIESGAIANSQNAVKELLQGMEKLNNVVKEERSIIKITTLTHYIEFLMKQDQIKSKLSGIYHRKEES